MTRFAAIDRMIFSIFKYLWIESATPFGAARPFRYF